MTDVCDRNHSDWVLVRSGYVARRSTATLIGGQIVSSGGLLDDRCLRSESQRLGACSVGLRRSEIDGYFDRGFGS